MPRHSSEKIPETKAQEDERILLYKFERELAGKRPRLRPAHRSLSPVEIPARGVSHT